MHLPSIQAPCVPQEPDVTQDNKEHAAHLAFEAMGCRFEMILDSTNSRCDNQAIAEEMRDLVLEWHDRLSIFEPSSMTSRINGALSGVEIVLDSDMYNLCALSDHLRIRTHGAFNIATGTLTHPTNNNINLNTAFTLNPENQSITKTDDRVAIDFGAIAKGFVLDLIRNELQAYGITNAFMHGGTSSVLAVGTNSWSIQVGDTYRVNMQNFAAGVSENNSQTKELQGITVGHLMDPITNNPVRNSTVQVVCIHKCAAVADAYATACCVLPTLVDELTSDPCTIIVFDSKIHPTIHDPLDIVQTNSKDAT